MFSTTSYKSIVQNKIRYYSDLYDRTMEKIDMLEVRHWHTNVGKVFDGRRLTMRAAFALAVNPRKEKRLRELRVVAEKAANYLAIWEEEMREIS